MKLRQKILHLWRTGNFITKSNPTKSSIVWNSMQWIEYEDYMQAKVFVKDKLGLLLVKFPPECSENNRLHSHPISDRIITILEGSGQFEFYYRNQFKKLHISVGDTLYMPRGVIHTFRSNHEGMLVQSVHTPYIPLDNN